MYVLEDDKAPASVFPVWVEVHENIWEAIFRDFVCSASESRTTCSQTTLMFDQWVQVWSSPLKPVLSGLSGARPRAADVCLALHVRTDCSYSGCQLYIQTSQQDIWWSFPFSLCLWNSHCPLFHAQSCPKSHYNKGIVIVNTNFWSGYDFVAPQTTSTAVPDYSSAVWLHISMYEILSLAPCVIWLQYVEERLKLGVMNKKRHDWN